MTTDPLFIRQTLYKKKHTHTQTTYNKKKINEN